jgi:hypothetical protein
VLSALPTAKPITVNNAWGVPAGTVPNDPDWIWWSQHTACLVNGQLGP